MLIDIMGNDTKNYMDIVKDIMQKGIKQQEDICNKNISLLHAYMNNILNNIEPKKKPKNSEDLLTLYNTTVKNMSDMAKQKQSEFFKDIAKIFEPKPDVKTGEIKQTASSMMLNNVLLLKEQSDNIVKAFKNQYTKQIEDYEIHLKLFQLDVIDMLNNSENYTKIKNLTGSEFFTSNIEDDGISIKIPETTKLKPGDKVRIVLTKIADDKSSDEDV